MVKQQVKLVELNAMGQETNLTVSSSGELDNGLSIKGSFRSEDGSVDHSSIKVSGDTLGFEIGADTGSTIHTQINPTVGRLCMVCNWCKW